MIICVYPFRRNKPHTHTVHVWFVSPKRMNSNHTVHVWFEIIPLGETNHTCTAKPLFWILAFSTPSHNSNQFFFPWRIENWDSNIHVHIWCICLYAETLNFWLSEAVRFLWKINPKHSATSQEPVFSLNCKAICVQQIYNIHVNHKTKASLIGNKCNCEKVYELTYSINHICMFENNSKSQIRWI